MSKKYKVKYFLADDLKQLCEQIQEYVNDNELEIESTNYYKNSGNLVDIGILKREQMIVFLSERSN